MTTKGPKRILFLLNDIDEVLLRVVQVKFKKDAGWNSIITTSYDDAMSAYLNKKPDVVMTEITIHDSKGRSGFDFIAEVKEAKNNHSAIMIIFTDLAQDEDKKKAEELGVKHYFVKSDVSLKQLIDDIKKIISA